jgi:site-specific DNA recombinase
MVRYAAYIRTSTDAQTGNFPIDAQRRAIEAGVAAQGGQLIKVYIDKAPACMAERPAFQQMLQDARAGAFDALVIHRLDRLARNQADALTAQATLQDDCKAKIIIIQGRARKPETELYA